MAEHTATTRMTLHSHSPRVRILDGDVLVADSRNAIELRECGYPHRHYIPKEDVDMSKLSVLSTVTHCPFKGDDWSDEHSMEPIDERLAIAEQPTFDAHKVKVHVE